MRNLPYRSLLSPRAGWATDGSCCMTTMLILWPTTTIPKLWLSFCNSLDFVMAPPMLLRLLHRPRRGCPVEHTPTMLSGDHADEADLFRAIFRAARKGNSSSDLPITIARCVATPSTRSFTLDPFATRQSVFAVLETRGLAAAPVTPTTTAKGGSGVERSQGPREEAISFAASEGPQRG